MKELTKKEQQFLYELVTNLPIRVTLATLPTSPELQELMALAAKLKSDDGDDTISDEEGS